MTGAILAIVFSAAGLLSLVALADSAIKARRAWRRIKGESLQ